MTAYAVTARDADTGIGGATSVLVADDDPAVRRLLRLALELEGFAVTTVADGDSALEAARTQLPSAELGWAVTVVMLTGQREVLGRVSALDNGADDYVEKPAGCPRWSSGSRAAWPPRSGGPKPVGCCPPPICMKS